MLEETRDREEIIERVAALDIVRVPGPGPGPSGRRAQEIAGIPGAGAVACAGSGPGAAPPLGGRHRIGDLAGQPRPHRVVSVVAVSAGRRPSGSGRITVVPEGASAVIDDGDGAVVVTTAGGRRVRGQRLLLAAGLAPGHRGVALDSVGVKTGDRGEIVVDEQLRSTNPRIWASWDVTGHPQYVYIAAAHGTLVADNALNDAEKTVNYAGLPAVTAPAPRPRPRLGWDDRRRRRPLRRLTGLTCALGHRARRAGRVVGHASR